MDSRIQANGSLGSQLLLPLKFLNLLMEMPSLSLCLSLDLERFHGQFLGWAGGRGILFCKRNHLRIPFGGFLFCLVFCCLVTEQTVTCSGGFDAFS